MNGRILFALVAWIACGTGCTTQGRVNTPTDASEAEAGQPTGDPQDTGHSANGMGDTGVGTDTADSGARPEEPVNLLRNPGFEDGDAHWSVWGGAEVVGASAHEGERALRMTRVNGAEQLVERLEPNTTYRLTGRARTDNPDHAPSIGVKGHGYPEARVRFAQQEYRQDSLEFSTGFGTTL